MRQRDWDASFTDYVFARRAYLRRFAYTLTRDWDSAEDLLQISLIKAYDAWPRIRQRGAEDSFVRTTMLRAMIDERRRPWRREQVGIDGLPEPSVPPSAAVEDVDEVLWALLQLPLMQRGCVALRHWLGLSVEETARELGIAEGTVKAHTHRGLARLRELLPDQEEQPC